MVRHAIEDIKYTGGSTLTASAIELSVDDLESGRRPDAIQVKIMNKFFEKKKEKKERKKTCFLITMYTDKKIYSCLNAVVSEVRQVFALITVILN